MIKFLGISGALFVLSIFTGSCLFLTFSFTLFIIAVILNCIKLWKGRSIVNLVVDKTHDNAINCFKNREYGKASVYFLSYPIVVVGIFFASLTLICMWVMLLK